MDLVFRPWAWDCWWARNGPWTLQSLARAYGSHDSVIWGGVPGTHAWLGAHGSVAPGQTLTISPTCLTCCWGKGWQLYLMSWSEWLSLCWPQSACSPKAGPQTFETLCVGSWGCQGQLTLSSSDVCISIIGIPGNRALTKVPCKVWLNALFFLTHYVFLTNLLNSQPLNS